MKVRTISEVKSKELGHKRFANFIRLAESDGYDITDIREYNEKFKFKMNNHDIEYSKNCKNAKQHYEFIKELIKKMEELDNVCVRL